MRRARLVVVVVSAMTTQVNLALEPVFPGSDWQRRSPVEVGLNGGKLEAFSDAVGGRGCVTRFGCMVYSWGDAAKPGDVASACKPFFSHFLFAALEDGRIAGLDEKAIKYEPRLGQINAALGRKDKDITWRHFATQTSCYQVAERPGAAFCYNDWQMALFWDTLFLKVYGAEYATVDSKVFRPMLADPIGCQDEPTLMAFGTKDRPGRVAISPRDFCRFGLLYLSRGNWNGKQLLDEKHAVLALTSPLPAALPRAGSRLAEMIPGQRTLGSGATPDNQCPHQGSYSFLWWINGVDEKGRRLWPGVPDDAYGAFGHGGPRAMVVIPSLHLVFSWNDARLNGWDQVGRAIKLCADAVTDHPMTQPTEQPQPRATQRREEHGKRLSQAQAAPSAEGWPQWRGPRHNGVTGESSNWPVGWPPKRLWSANVGTGCTSPIIAEGRVFVMGWAGAKRDALGTDSVYCFDCRTGREIWRQSYSARYQGRMRAGDTEAYGGPLATPAFDPATGRLYTLGVDGELRCWDGRGDGQLVWAKKLYELFKIERRPDVGGGQRDYGFTCAPLIQGDLLIVQVGDAGGTVAAFDKQTGQLRWRSEHAGPAGHSGGIVPLRVGATDALAVLTLRELVLIRPADGKTIASHPWQTDCGCNLPTPAVDGSKVLLTSGYNQSKAVLLDFASGRTRQVWQSDAFATVASPVIAGKRAFLINDRLQCLDLDNGKVLWKGGRLGHGSCVATADGRLIVFGNGRLVLVDATANVYRELAVAENLVKGTCYPQLAVASRAIVCKDRDGRIVCLSFGSDKPPQTATTRPASQGVRR